MGDKTVVEVDWFLVGADSEVADIVNAHFLHYWVVFLLFVEDVYFFGAFRCLYDGADAIFLDGVFTFDCEVVPRRDVASFLL